MTEQILALELRLLILRYSRRRIIDAFAALGDQTPEEVERELAAVLERKARRNTKPKERIASDLIADACRDRPEIVELVSTLVSRFENRTFLPELRDVVRFLDRAGVSHGKLKSRRLSTPVIVVALARLNADELHRLAAPPATEGDSDLALLAREIMGGGRARRAPKEQKKHGEEGTQASDKPSKSH
jgi:hypothetical protein